MSKGFITRKEHFSAAHRLYKPEYSDEKNFEIFGGCSNPNWHGHNYSLWVTVSGEVDNETGFIANLKEISRIINEKVISRIDHKNINLEVGFMKGKLASTENLAIGIWNELISDIEALNVKLHSVRIGETENNFAEYYGEE